MANSKTSQMLINILPQEEINNIDTWKENI